MPDVRRRLETAFSAPPAAVTDAATTLLGLTPHDDGALTGSLSGTTGLRLHVVVQPLDGDATRSRALLTAESDEHIPYFGWFLDALRRIDARRELRYTVARLEAALSGTAAPERPRPL